MTRSSLLGILLLAAFSGCQPTCGDAIESIIRAEGWGPIDRLLDRRAAVDKCQYMLPQAVVSCIARARGRTEIADCYARHDEDQRKAEAIERALRHGAVEIGE